VSAPRSKQVGRRQRILRGLWVSATVIAVVLVLLLGRLFESVRLGLSDIYFVPAPVSGNIVIVALDDASLQSFGRSPTQWSRTIYAT